MQPVIVPIVKDKCGNLSDMNISIAMSNVLSKLFESVLEAPLLI